MRGRIGRWKPTPCRKITCFLIIGIISAASAWLGAAQSPKPVDAKKCIKKVLPESKKRNAVYKGTPFRPGEVSEYKVSYFGVLVGYGTIKVNNPLKFGGQWYQSVTAEGKTGDWYRAFFIAHDIIRASIHPHDLMAHNFYIQQDEGKMFGSRYVRQKWIDFDHTACQAVEKVVKNDKPPSTETKFFQPLTHDVLGATLKMRTLDYKIGKTISMPVYTSEKNWVLKAEPVAMEQVEVPAGKFKAVKLKLTTFLGDQFQQKGDVHIWIAQDHPARPMVRIQGEIKIGSVEMELNTFKKGR